jgi:DNA-binding CsgD family transcriptional regulator
MNTGIQARETNKAVSLGQRQTVHLGYKALLVLLLVFIQSTWFQMVSYNTFYAAPSDFLPDIPLERVARNATCLIACIAMAVFDKPIRHHNKVLMPLMTALVFFGTTIFILANYQTVMPKQLFATIGTVILSIGYVWVYLSIFRVFKHNGTLWEIALCVITINSLARISLTLFLTYLTPMGMTIVALSAELATGILLYLVHRILQIDDEPRLPGFRMGSAIMGKGLKDSHSLRIHLLMILILTFTVNFMRTLNDSGPWNNTHTTRLWLDNLWVLFLVIAIHAAIGSLLFYFCIHRKGSLWAQMPFLFMMAALVTMMYLRFDFIETPLYSVYSAVLEIFAQLVYFFTLLRLVRSIPFSSFKVMGLANGFSFLLSLLLTPIAFVFSDTSASIIVLALVAFYLVAVIISASNRDAELALPTGRNGAISGAAAGAEGAEWSDLYKGAEIAAQKAKLTRRETEIMLLLVKGKSLPMIQKELHIAGGTGRTHIKHIYTKLGVHSRQELMAIIYPIDFD